MTLISLDGRNDGAEPAGFVTLEQVPDLGTLALDLANTDDVRSLTPVLLARITVIRVAFPGFGDGRGFSLGRRLRDLGYRGRLRAAGPVIPDQRAALAACGFDEVELDPALLARQGGLAVWQTPVAVPPYLRRGLDARAAARASAA